MNPYAQNTEVPVERSRAEIEKLLLRYGATDFMSGWSGRMAMIGFRARGRTIRFVLTMPEPGEKRFTHTSARKTQRSPGQASAAWEQECRRGWRALALAIKAKLEAVQTGIATFEDEFLAYTVLPGGRTVAEDIQPKITAAIAAGRLNVPLLAIGTGETIN